MQNRLRTVFLGFVIALCVDSFATAQGLQSSPYAAPTLLRRDNLSFAPSNTYDRSNTNGGFLKEHQSDLMGASWLKNIPNLQTGYVYYSAEKWRAGYLTLDYMLPIRMGANSIVFGEAHSEFQVSSTRSTRRVDDQVYLSMGGGYRTILRKTTLVGINGFYDGARFARQWVSSGGAGFEWAALLPGYDALDMNFNWYGDLFNVGGAVVYEKRNGPSNFEFQAGYSHQLFEGGPDLRLYGTAYKFDDKSGVWGWQAGFELKTPNGVMSAKGETAYDQVNSSYQTVSAFVNIGFQLENLLSGRNPFVMPERIFNSPRNFNRLTDKVKRNWQQTVHGVSVVVAQNDLTNNLQTINVGGVRNNPQTITVVNNRSTTVRLYMGMTGGWGRYSAADFPGFSDGRLINCNLAGNVVYKDLQPGEHVDMKFDPSKGPISPAFSPDMCPWGDCPQTLGEFTLIGNDNKDTVDISLVNGFKYPMEIRSSTGDRVAKVCTATGNQQNINVFPLGCDTCTCNNGMPPWATCQNPPRNVGECKQTKNGDHNCADQAGNPVCQTPYPLGANYTVNILPDLPCSLNQ